MYNISMSSKLKKPSAVNYKVVEYVRSILHPDMQITGAQVHNKWVVCTLTSKNIKMASYNGGNRLAASITFRVKNF